MRMNMAVQMQKKDWKKLNDLIKFILNEHTPSAGTAG